MKNTGEQLILGESNNRLVEEHVLRYKFITKYCYGKKILDIACGTGYGSYQLSQIAGLVVGVDLSDLSIKTAKERYQNENLSFIVGDCAQVSFEHKFDVIVSFETVEHLDESTRKKFYNICSNFLENDGIFIVSTPNKKICSPYSDKPLNKFHVLEFTKQKLELELSQIFSIQEWFGQRFIYTFLTWKLVRKFVRLIEVLLKKDFKIYSELTSPNVKKWNKYFFIQPRIMLSLMKKKN
jgi:2-polyprenyl-3-methyl-5-hydroxy-6-metoxy-1,4-benzoquinol methylase